MTDDVLAMAFERECSWDGCARRRSLWGMSSLCIVHSILNDAEWLSADDLAEVQEQLRAVVPMTKAERRKRRRQSALSSIERDARNAQRSIESAKASGATTRQIAAAQRRGLKKATS